MSSGRLRDLVDQVTTKAHGRKSAGLRYVGLENIDPGGRTLTGTAPSSVSDSTNGVFENGDILFGKLRPGLRKAVQVDFCGYCSTDLLVLRPRTGVDVRYAGHVTASEPVFRHAERNSIGTGMPRTSWHAVCQAPVWIPSMEEQQRIAAILDKIDETIQVTERVITKLRLAHEALQQQLVPKPTSDGVEMARLGALVDPKRPIVYGILMPGEHVIGGVPVIKVKDITNGKIANRPTLLHTSPLIDQQYERSRVRKGDLLFTIRGSVGRTAIVPESHDGANITQDTARIAVTGVHRSYLAAVMATETFARYVGVHTIGQAVKGINLRELRRAPIPLVTRREQEIAGAAFEDSTAAQRAERDRLNKLRVLRAGLEADLLSGQLRTVTA